MKAHVTATLTKHGIELRGEDAKVREDRPFTDEDVKTLQGWAARYQAAAKKKGRATAELLALGEEIYGWLDGATHFLARLLDAVEPPLSIEFATGREDTAEARAFLDAPWELLAREGQHWALRADTVYCPIRRIGKAGQPAAPSENRLGLVFMAAAPRGADNLKYEAEEAAIMSATKDLGLDLAVEESGTLEQLAVCVAQMRPEVVQISCHGTLEPEPGLLLEDEVGDADYATATRLISKLGAQHTRLLFLSACETAEADDVLDSLARSLTRGGAPAVLGWAAPVSDVEATIFAAGLHGRLTVGEAMEHALAYARFDLCNSDELPEAADGGPRSRDWHLARLYLGAKGGGAPAKADGPRRMLGSGRAGKTFLDTKGKQVPVAGEREFVGRRGETQAILRAFRTSDGDRPAGVFIHGLGRQGKSSLAARTARRMEHTHEPIVIFGRYDAQAILGAFRNRVGTKAVTEIVERYLPLVEQDETKLQAALMELLQGPCDQQRTDEDGRFLTRPALVVVDDFERALEEEPTGARHCVRPELVEPVRALIRAFNEADTDSRLLFTSRYQFTAPDGEVELADKLQDLPLHGMDEREAYKQIAAKLRAKGKLSKQQQRNVPELMKRADRIIGAARGNPGLQDIVFSLCLERPEACDRCLEQMEEYGRSGTAPVEEEAGKFFENLAIGALLDLLTEGQRELLRGMTMFGLPVPEAVVKLLAERGAAAAGKDGMSRLIGLGLCEVYEDLHDSEKRALAVNALVRPLAGDVGEEEAGDLAGLVCERLFEEWGGEAGGRQRQYVLDVELTRLALAGRAAKVLAGTGAYALRFLEDQFAYKQAAEWAEEIVGILDEAGTPASVGLLRTAAERLHSVGEVATAGRFRERALGLIEEAERSGETIDVKNHAAMLLTHARALAEQGRPDEAMELLERAKGMLPEGREQAIVTGDIARLLAQKGDVEAALALHQERLEVYERLGDKRSRAITLGDIARLRAGKGEVEAALELHQEELEVYEGLGDKRSRAVALGDIARLRAKKGEVEAALVLHQERLEVYESLGDLDGIAAALWGMAQIELGQEKHQEAAEHMAKSYEINLKLGRLDGICFVGMALGQLLYLGGQREAGIAVLTRSREGFEKLGRMDLAGKVQGILDRIKGIENSEGGKRESSE